MILTQKRAVVFVVSLLLFPPLKLPAQQANSSEDTFQEIDLSLFQGSEIGAPLKLESEHVSVTKDLTLGSIESEDENAALVPQAKSALDGCIKKFQRVNASDLKHPLPVYPPLARENGWQGLVVIRALIQQEGNPAQVEIERTSGFQILDQSAIESVRQWEFSPTRSGNLTLSRWILIPVRFALTSKKF